MTILDLISSFIPLYFIFLYELYKALNISGKFRSLRLAIVSLFFSLIHTR